MIKKLAPLLVFMAGMIAGCEPETIIVNDNRLSVYPNPANDFAYVSVNLGSPFSFDSVPYTLKAFDVRGKMILHVTAETTGEFQLTLPEPGGYYVLLKVGDEEIKRNLVGL